MMEEYRGGGEYGLCSTLKEARGDLHSRLNEARGGALGDDGSVSQKMIQSLTGEQHGGESLRKNPVLWLQWHA